jgi:3-oxoacyl-[acyl-carrier protein] reductase
MSNLLESKTAIITGSNRGIGKKILEKFAINKSNILACSRIKDEVFEKYIDDLSKKHNVKIEPVYFDFENRDEMIKQTKEKILINDKIDILVNNASTIDTSLFEMTKISNIKKIFDINFFNQVEFTQLIVKKLKKASSGSIINMSSTSAKDGNVGRLSYSTSKAAIETFTKVLANELAKYNIRVNSISPGPTNTRMMNENTPVKLAESLKENIPMKRFGEVEDIASVALFLSSDMSIYITGQNLRVSGGM